MVSGDYIGNIFFNCVYKIKLSIFHSITLLFKIYYNIIYTILNLYYIKYKQNKTKYLIFLSNIFKILKVNF